MDQKWTKRQNERPQETPEFELRPFRKQVTTCTLCRYEHLYLFSYCILTVIIIMFNSLIYLYITNLVTPICCTPIIYICIKKITCTFAYTNTMNLMIVFLHKKKLKISVLYNNAFAFETIKSTGDQLKSYR